jgi:hypothetical protein
MRRLRPQAHLLRDFMGKRSGYPDSDEDYSKLSLAEFEAEISRCLWGYENGGTSQARKAFFQRLIRTEAHREKVHGAPAPKRRF